MGEILFIAHRLPFPPDRGDKIRSHHLLRALAALAPVHVACFADDVGDAAHEGELAALAASHCLVPRAKPLALAGLEALATGRPVSLAAFADRRLRGYVEQVLRERPIGAVFVFSGQMGHHVPASWGGPLVIDFVDVDSAKFGAYAKAARGPMAWVHAREERLLRAEEGCLAARATASLLVSEPEADLFRSRLAPALQGCCTVRALGNGIDAASYDPAGAVAEPRLALLPGPRLIFTGQMDYPPNVAAVVRAATRIMPLVRAACPQASFHVVGRKPTAEVLALDGLNGCRVWGRVDDVRPWLKGAEAALVPLEIARGVQNKVLEAMAMGLPVVASPEAATGIAVTPGETIAIGTSDADMAEAVIALARDPDMARAMGQGARARVIAAHAWPAMLADLPALLGLGKAERVRDAA
ncbi:TIGR03087 family PEP-CTERM/XrtA system glycosyltransferase [Novosphingobium bradum]|uniref:TIGR03087 family PEP-CTERM/XrtA system glycosyltransferase n=1 Tax=Novosphingobium bradum TaxID=1737444 RepID=A0ABV7IWT5_9SPHN